MKPRWKWQNCDATFKPVWTGQAVVHCRLVILKMRINDFCGIKQTNTSGLCSILESTNGSPQKCDNSLSVFPNQSIKTQSVLLPSKLDSLLMDESTTSFSCLTAGKNKREKVSVYLSSCSLGMGRYTYLPIRYYHDTWVPIGYVLRFILRILFF